MRPHPARLLGLATASPPNVITQSDAAEAAERMFAGRFRDFERLSAVFRTTGIRTRRSVRPIDWFSEPRGWPERTAAYLEGAEALFVDCATKALEAAELTAAEVDAIVTVSSTGIATPSLEARVMSRMGFRNDVQRVPVFGLGCAGGVTGLSLADRLARAAPGSKVLFVTIEICTLAFRLDELTKANIVATALFGDGAAACVLSTEGRSPLVFEGAGEHTWYDTLDIMGWNVDPQGFGVIFARSIPPFATKHLGPAMRGMLERLGLTMDDVDRFVCHPGGAKVVTALESAYHLDQGSLDHEREVLAEHGNMSAPTVLFVLERFLQREAAPKRSVLSSLGPGFTASALSLLNEAA
jgi:alkylresorcinol/alkylpyrone synthase